MAVEFSEIPIVSKCFI